MGRKKYEINNEFDADIFCKYITKNKEECREEIAYNESYKVRKKAQNRFDKQFEISVASRGSIAEIIVGEKSIYKHLTTLLYMLQYNRINKIKTTIRARRFRDANTKKALSVDAYAHKLLTAYSKRYDITLSDAIIKSLEEANLYSKMKETKGKKMSSEILPTYTKGK